MREKLARLPQELGALGLGSLLLLAVVAVFHFIALQPLQARNELLKERVSRQAPRAQAGEPETIADKVGAVYDFLRRDDQTTTTDWLAKLHGIGTATGVQLKSARYRTQPTEGRIVRYEIVLPVSGSYPQLRDFLKRSLAEIPVLSLDQITLKRESRNDGALNAELRMTLHMVSS
jgi:Tfp pilus assembly protein PilO